MTATVFVDTNVFVYARDIADPIKQRSAAVWIERLWTERRGRTGVQVLNEFYVTVTRKLEPGLSQSDARADVRAVFAWNPQPIDCHLVLRAQEVESRHALSWWDSMIVAAAQLQNCAILLTEDLHEGLSCDGVTVVNPFSVHVEEEAAHYETHPTPVSRHRPRGRPRRKAIDRRPDDQETE